MALYTLELKNILNLTFGDGTQTIQQFLQEECAKLPDLSEVTGDSFYDLFMRRNSFKEIGAETLEFWVATARAVFDECRILYKDKVQLQLDNIDNVLSRVINEEDSSESRSYLNPANKAVETLKVQSVNTNVTKQQRVAGLLKSNSEIMKEMTELEIEYVEMLKYLDRLFFALI